MNKLFALITFFGLVAFGSSQGVIQPFAVVVPNEITIIDAGEVAWELVEQQITELVLNGYEVSVEDLIVEESQLAALNYEDLLLQAGDKVIEINANKQK